MTRSHTPNTSHVPGELPAWELLDRYHAGDATPEERAVVDEYLAAHPVVASTLGAVTQRLRRSLAGAPSVATMLAAAHERLALRTSLRQRAGVHLTGRLEHAMATLLDSTDTQLSESEVEELRRLIDSAREEGR